MVLTKSRHSIHGASGRLGSISFSKKMSMRPEKLSDKVADYIALNISDANFMPGKKIVPRDIAKKLGVSLMPVRDALERLEQKGWIVRYPQSGTYVKKIDPQEMDEKCNMRAMLESEAVINLVESGSSENFEQLRELIVENELARKNQDINHYGETDILFHLRLVELGCSDSLAEIHAEIMGRIRYNFSIVFLNSELEIHESIDLCNVPVPHKDIFDAIEKRDLVTALGLTRGHINKSRGRYRKILELSNLVDSEMFNDSSKENGVGDFKINF